MPALRWIEAPQVTGRPTQEPVAMPLDVSLWLRGASRAAPGLLSEVVVCVPPSASLSLLLFLPMAPSGFSSFRTIALPP